MAGSRGNCIWRRSASAAWVVHRSAALDDATRGGYAVVERPGRKRVHVEVFCETRDAARELVARFGGSVAPLSSGWQARFFSSGQTNPIRAGSRLIVAADPADRPKEEKAALTLIIPASAAFGTGAHATTAMSLRMLERVTRRLPRGWRMLDAGTGSGILALAGRCFGAGEVIAVDDDALAVSVAKQNARANRIDGVTFVVGDVNRGPTGRFDLIAANLYSELLISLLPKWRKRLAANGRLILSGVLRNQEPELRRALRCNGFAALEIRRRGKWIALLSCTMTSTSTSEKRG